MALTYDELVRRAPIWLYAQNRDITSEMPAIIEQAEDTLLKRIDHDEFKTEITGAVLSTTGVIDLTAADPAVLEIRAVRVKYRQTADAWWPLLPRDLELLSAMFLSDRPGDPRFYAERGSPLRLQVFPKPRVLTDLSITANVAPVRLGPAQQENVYTKKYPRAIEKAVFYSASLFMRDIEGAQQYSAEMDAALLEAGAQVARRRRDETGTRPRETQNVTGS